jgi:hypothetical protein
LNFARKITFELNVPNDLLIKVFSSCEELGKAIHIGKPCYFRPESKTFASIDSLYWDGRDNLYFLQATIGEKHGIVHKAIVNLLKKCISEFQRRNGLKLKLKFAFIVPEKIAGTFKKQNYQRAEKKTKRINPIVNSIKQFIITFLL